jgi:hypothetical protein
MALAFANPEPSKLKRKSPEATSTALTVSKQELSKARIVLSAGRDDLAPAVLAGTMELKAALAKAVERRDAGATERAQMERLRTEAADPAHVDNRRKVAEQGDRVPAARHGAGT